MTPGHRFVPIAGAQAAGPVNRQAAQQNDRNRVRHVALELARCARQRHRTRCQRIVSNDPILFAGDESPARAAGLIGEGAFSEPIIQGDFP